MTKPVIICCLLIAYASIANAQQKITFTASDSLIITADFFRSGKPSDPYVLFFHQEASSRGEYLEIAPRIKKLGYNCLVVDLRYGDSEGFTKNETSLSARNRNLTPAPADAKLDIEAAINYAYNRNHKPVILFGSSFSASLCLIIANHNRLVQGVIAFSPGEFFGSGFSVKKEIAGLDKPLFVASTKLEIPYIREMLAEVNSGKLTLMFPKQGNGVHGAKALWPGSESSEEYWLALMLFFRQLSEDSTNR